MLPFIEIGAQRFETAALVYALAVLAAGAFYLVRLRRRRHRSGPAARALLLVVLGGGLGANLGGAASLGWELLTGSPIPVPLKSVSFPGALVGGTVAVWLVCRHYRISFWRVCDVAIVALPLGQAIGQLGCLARGCCYGRPTVSWLGLYLPDRYGQWAVRYPTHLWCAAADLLTLGVLLALSRPAQGRPASLLRPAPGGEAAGGIDDGPRSGAHLSRGAVSEGEWERRPAGLLTLLYLALYLLQRFAVEFVRGDALPAWIGPLNSTHVLCLAGLALVAAAAARKLWRAPRSVDQERAPA